MSAWREARNRKALDRFLKSTWVGLEGKPSVMDNLVLFVSAASWLVEEDDREAAKVLRQAVEVISGSEAWRRSCEKQHARARKERAA